MSDGKLAWVHSSREFSQREIGVYLMTWENPWPDQVIQSLDYESTMTDAAPFFWGSRVKGLCRAANRQESYERMTGIRTDGAQGGLFGTVA